MICRPFDLERDIGRVTTSGRQVMRGTGYDIRTKKGRVKRRILADVVRRVVEAAAAEKIILFGSAARGEMGPDSDIDLLVIKNGKFNRRRLTTAIYRHLSGSDAAVDVVVVTPEEIERYRSSPYLVIHPALQEGEVVALSALFAVSLARGPSHRKPAPVPGDLRPGFPGR